MNGKSPWEIPRHGEWDWPLPFLGPLKKAWDWFGPSLAAEAVRRSAKKWSSAVVSSFLIRLLGWTDEPSFDLCLLCFFQGECTCSAQYMGCWLNMGYPQNPVAWKLILLNQQGHSLWVNPCFQTVTWLRSVSCFPLLAFAESAGLVIHLLSNPVF